MSEDFRVNIDNLLRDGKVVKIDETVSPCFLDVEENELSFSGEVQVKGEAYLADGNLILHLSIKAQALMPCSICNEDVTVDVQLDNFYHTEELENLKNPVFDFTHILREAVLLDLPPLAECSGSACPKRAEFSRYFAKPSDEEASGEDGHKPFADLNL